MSELYEKVALILLDSLYKDSHRSGSYISYGQRLIRIEDERANFLREVEQITDIIIEGRENYKCRTTKED